MTHILHTADVHLTSDSPERREALDDILTLAETEDVDLVTIGGDLFDRPEDVEELRADLRNDLFSNQPFQILLIPGNHDVAAFRGDVFFGDACTTLTQQPFEHWTSPEEGIRVTGIPYKERPDDDLLLALQDREPFEGVEIILLHCSLDAPFDSFETGDEGTRRYFPVTEDLLAELEFDYYLAGHYHSSHKVSFDDGSEFTYPGTPASTNTDETGRRRVSILDTEVGLDFETLDAFHYASREFTATPGGEEELLDNVEEWADQHAIESAEASVHVDGFIEMDEDEFYEQLASRAEPASVTDDTRGVRHLLSHPLFRSFEDELQDTDWDADISAAVTERTLEVFSQLAVQGDI